MSLINEFYYRETSRGRVPRHSVWNDAEFQNEKGKQLAIYFRFSIMTGVQLRYPPILPGVRVLLPNPSGSLLNKVSQVVPDQNHPFTKAFSDELKVKDVEELVTPKDKYIDFLYLTSGTITLEQIGAFHQYSENEMLGQTDGVLLPAVRVVFNPLQV